MIRKFCHLVYINWKLGTYLLCLASCICWWIIWSQWLANAWGLCQGQNQKFWFISPVYRKFQINFWPAGLHVQRDRDSPTSQWQSFVGAGSQRSSLYTPLCFATTSSFHALTQLYQICSLDLPLIFCRQWLSASISDTAPPFPSICPMEFDQVKPVLDELAIHSVWARGGKSVLACRNGDGWYGRRCFWPWQGDSRWLPICWQYVLQV